MSEKTNAIIRPGEEPERVKHYIDLLCADIDRVYPHKIVDPAYWQHARWDQATTLLCNELGYATGEDFLSAYGYTVMAVPGIGLLDAPAGVDLKITSEESLDKPANDNAVGETIDAQSEKEHSIEKSALLLTAGIWWKKFHNRLMASKAIPSGGRFNVFHPNEKSGNETALADTVNDRNADASGGGTSAEVNPDERVITEEYPDSENTAETQTEDEANSEAPATSDILSIQPGENSLDMSDQTVDDEAVYPEIPLDVPVAESAESSKETEIEYTGKHSKPVQTEGEDAGMQALLDEFRNAEATPGTEAAHTPKRKPAPNPEYKSPAKEKKEREYTAKELFEATFGGIEFDDDVPEDEIARVFEEKEPIDRTPAFIKRIASKMKGKGKQFAAVFAGILIMSILAVFLRVLIDRHEAAVEAAQAAAEAAEQNITYVSTGSFNVSVTMPAVYTEDPDLTQKEYNALAEELGYDKILLQADGSLIYIMSRQRQYQMRSEVADEVAAFFDGIAGSAAYPEIKSVEPDSDYANVKITLVGDDEPTHMATLSTDLAYYCGKYQRVNGSGLPTVVITVYNSSGEKINTYKPTCP